MGFKGFRVGEGWDTHALVPGRALVLGGVAIPHATGLLGHSDADVLLHAITDALLGAAALGDIGTHFPDSDAAFRGAERRGVCGRKALRLATSTALSSRRHRAWRRISRQCARASVRRWSWSWSKSM